MVPVVAVDIGRFHPEAPPPPPPPPLAELPRPEHPLPDPLPVPQPLPIEVVIVQFQTSVPPAEAASENVIEIPVEPAPAAAPAIAAAEVQSPGWESVREAILRYLAYPESARRRGEEGRVWLVLNIGPAGELVHLDGEGDSPRLTQAALHAARRAAPFRGAGPAVFRVPILFRLTGRADGGDGVPGA